MLIYNMTGKIHAALFSLPLAFRRVFSKCAGRVLIILGSRVFSLQQMHKYKRQRIYFNYAETRLEKQKQHFVSSTVICTRAVLFFSLSLQFCLSSN